MLRSRAAAYPSRRRWASRGRLGALPTRVLSPTSCADAGQVVGVWERCLFGCCRLPLAPTSGQAVGAPLRHSSMSFRAKAGALPDLICQADCEGSPFCTSWVCVILWVVAVVGEMSAKEMVVWAVVVVGEASAGEVAGRGVV